MSVTQKELIDTITTELGAAGTPISKVQVGAVLERLGQVSTRALQLGHDVTLPGLGKLKASQRAARTGRNPSTGAQMEIPAKTTVKLAASKALEEALN